MVAHGRQTHLSTCPDDSDHRRRRRKQRLAVAVVEIRIAEIRRSDGVVYFGLPLSSRHQQMEQDRTPACFFYLLKLATGTIARLGNVRQAHRQDHHGERIESHLQIGSTQIPDRTRDKQSANGAPQPGTQQVSRRVELRHQTEGKNKLIPLFIYGSKGGARRGSGGIWEVVAKVWFGIAARYAGVCQLVDLVA